MRRLTVVLALATTALLTTACGSSPPAGPGTATPTSTSPAPDRDKVEFADDLCGAVAKFIVPAAAYRPDTSSPAAAVTSIKTQLSGLSTGLAEANDDLTNVHTTNVPDGKAAVDSLRSTFAQLKQSVDNARAKLDGVDPNNQQAVATAVQEVAKDMSALGSMQNPLDQPALSGPEMEAAAAQAEECQKVKQVVGNRSTGSASAAPPTS
nr:hypothetical protein [Kibdelosporangium sp. MJ126-NF4]CEL13625.1 hypothetical protein [Kibdelosporangium sp. MJ126-NF4]CTQ99311.1 hypothetical protein [Kibdelosporangium sp. MJ126-NF4]